MRQKFETPAEQMAQLVDNHLTSARSMDNRNAEEGRNPPEHLEIGRIMDSRSPRWQEMIDSPDNTEVPTGSRPKPTTHSASLKKRRSQRKPHMFNQL
jgi:hypothetical protein